MKKIKKLVEKNIKLLVVVMVVLVVVLLAAGGVYASTILSSSEVSYSNSGSMLTATNVQDALDELYEKAENANVSNSGTSIVESDNIVEAYSYSGQCAAGNKAHCYETDCYESSDAGSCSPGTIVYYKVNDTTVVPFNVIEDHGLTMTMQSQRNVVYNASWTNGTDNTTGPLAALDDLERATNGWVNVNRLSTSYYCQSSDDAGCTGCASNYTSNNTACYSNTYTLSDRSSYARMITFQELHDLGCFSTSNSCPEWISDFLYSSPSGNYDSSYPEGYESYPNKGYWTMNAYSANSRYVWYVDYSGKFDYSSGTVPSYGVRAVVNVNKF